MAIACAALLLAAGGAGYLLAGRSLRPAARSIAQQEALLADAAHELRTPIASVRATLEAAQLDPSITATAIEEARSTSVRMGDTVAALLAWGRLTAGAERPDHTELRLDQLVEDIVAEVDPGGRVAVEAEPTVVVADPVLIRIAVRNLLDNALRHGGDTDVMVTVRTGTVAVADRGPGLSSYGATGGRVERYRSAGVEGTGLGLSIASRIAALHDGELTARDRSGGGSELVLALGGTTSRVGSR